MVEDMKKKASVGGEKGSHPRLPNAQECAILALRLIEIRNQDKKSSPVSRVRLSELTLRRLWGRDRFSREFLEEIQEWMSRGGWAFFFARTTYAAIKTSAVLGWSRLSSKRMGDDLKRVLEGNFDFVAHIHLLKNEDPNAKH
jgi:hypothetical protein